MNTNALGTLPDNLTGFDPAIREHTHFVRCFVPMSMDTDFLQKRRWDAQQGLVNLIRDLESQARYGAAAKCRAVLSAMLSGDLAGALTANGAIADASGASGVAQMFAALSWSLSEEGDAETAAGL